MEILKFSSKTCIPCRHLEKMLKENLPAEARLESLDAIDDRDAFYSYNVKSVPTLIFLDQLGEEVGRHVGMLKPEEFKKLYAEMKSKTE